MSSPAAGERPTPAYPAYPGAGAPPPRPPLTKRMRTAHWIVIDCAVGGFLAICDTAITAQSIGFGQARILFALLFMVTVFLPVALRRRAPVTAFGALLILGVLLSGLSPTVTGALFLGAAYVLYTVTVESRRRTGAAALGLILVVTVALVSVGHVRTRGPDPGVLVPVALANVIAWMTGYSVRQRRLYVVTLQQQAANSAVAEERLRIARELHDVVAHSMSVIAVQAGYGQYVIDASPTGAREALGAIQATSRDALEEMRRMLGVLRQQDGMSGPAGLAPVLGGVAAGRGAQPAQAPLAPAPGLAGLDRLIERTRGAGVRVTLEVTGRPRPAPAGVDLSAYRIIQEALTNVVRHAGTGAWCVVTVAYTDADLVVRVTDDGGLPVTLLSPSVAPAGSGHGIVGMRERVHLCGGTFSALPRPEGGFCVMAALPLPAFDLVAEGRSRTGADLHGEGFADDSPHAGLRSGDRGFAAGSADGTPAVTGAATGDGGGRE
jgi:signal transduction histidine kinase